jgi:hypothetical protein
MTDYDKNVFDRFHPISLSFLLVGLVAMIARLIVNLVRHRTIVRWHLDDLEIFNLRGRSYLLFEEERDGRRLGLFLTRGKGVAPPTNGGEWSRTELDAAVAALTKAIDGWPLEMPDKKPETKEDEQ